MDVIINRFRVYLIVLVLISTQIQLQAASLSENLLFISKLDANFIEPAIETDALGVASFMLNEDRDTISIYISIVGLEPNSIAI